MDSIYCQKCGSGSLNKDAKFCPDCGVELAIQLNTFTCAKCTRTDRASGRQMLFCRQCGKPMQLVGTEAKSLSA